MTEELEKKLRELIDQQKIQDMVLRYACGLDRKDFELVRSCYWDDASDDHHSFVGNSYDFIICALESTADSPVQHHGVGNHYIELAGDDAHGESYYTFFGAFEQPPHMLSISSGGACGKPNAGVVTTIERAVP